MKLRTAMMCGLALAGCSKAPDAQTPATKQQNELAQKLRMLDPEKEAEQLAPREYESYRALMTFAGMDKALGGVPATDAALRGLMARYRETWPADRAAIARMIKASVDVQAINGLGGLGRSLMSSLAAVAGAVSIGGSEPRGSRSNNADGRSDDISWDDRTIKGGETTEASFGDLSGKVTTRFEVDTCPDAEGRVTAHFMSDSDLSTAGRAAGASTQVDVTATRYIDDDARMTDPISFDMRVAQTTFEGGAGSFVDVSLGYDVSSSRETSVVNQRSPAATDTAVAIATELGKTGLVAALALIEQARAAWEGGRCVKLQPTTTPAKRTGAAPSTRFDIVAAPRAIDGAPTRGSVTATLTGDGTLNPNGTKVPADASFTYTAPGEKKKKGSVAFEARSRRGVGKATLAFDTNGAAYRASGGADAFHGSGTICNLGTPFTISGSGVTHNFTPSSETTGTYSYTGSMSGFSVRGSGSYTVSLGDNGGGKIVATGPGSVKTPMGVKSANGTETYTLTPADPC